jgi:hypothetical protein
VQALAREDLRRDITDAGLAIEHDWSPKPRSPLFLVARKPDVKSA